MTNKFTLEQVQTIVAEAQEAAQAETMTMAVRRGDHFPCGFAWVETTGIRSNSTLGKHLIACGFEKSWKSGVHISRLIFSQSALRCSLRSFGMNSGLSVTQILD